MLLLKLLVAYNIYLVSSLQTFNFIGQNQYDVILERVELFWKNDQITNGLSTKTFKFNRTLTVFNMNASFKVDINSWKVQGIGYKFSSNDYKRTAMQATVDCCHIMKNNYFGMGKLIKSIGNMTDCPVNKGNYVLRNGMLDSRRFPPNLPEGRAKLELTHFINDKRASVFNVYGEIRYIVKVKKH